MKFEQFNSAFGRLRRVAAMCFLSFLFASGLRADGHLPVLRLSTGNLPPVSTPQRDGYLNRLLVELFGRVGHAIEIVDLPGRRALASANNGLIDGDAARMNVLASTYPNLRQVEPAIIEVDFLGLYVDGSIKVETAEDFTKYSVGYVRGWQIAETLFEDHPNAIAASNPENLFKMLSENRIEVAFLTRAPGLLLAEQRKMNGVKLTAYSDRRSLYIHLNSRHAELLPALASAMTDMHKDGTYAKLTDGYGSK